MAGVVAIVLCEPMKGDFIGWAIDRATGRRGWSHVFVDLGWPSSGRDPIVCDISRERGVELTTWSKVAGERGTMRIELESGDGRIMLERLLPCIGRPYNNVAMVLQPLRTEALRGTFCSAIVAECLPEPLRKLLPPVPCPADFLNLREVCCG